MAYLADDGVSWDALAQGDDAIPYPHDNPWEHRGDRDAEFEQKRRARALWQKISEKNRAMTEAVGVVPYEDILAIDEEGDDVTDLPHIFVKFIGDQGPFAHGRGVVIAGDRRAPIDPAHKIKFFPDELPPSDLPEGNVEPQGSIPP
jgi:hypothetical protein